MVLFEKCGSDLYIHGGWVNGSGWMWGRVKDGVGYGWYFLGYNKINLWGFFYFSAFWVMDKWIPLGEMNNQPISVGANGTFLAFFGDVLWWGGWGFVLDQQFWKGADF